MAAKKKKWRLKKSVRRTLYAILGTIIGVFMSCRLNVIAQETNVVVAEDKISIDDYEYFKNNYIIKVTLPNGLQQIGFSGFEGCSALSDINLPEGLSVIDNRAFARCASLARVDIPESVVFIGNATFYGCTSLDNVVIPQAITSLSNNLFYGCEALSEISIPSVVTSIGQQTFCGCTSLRKIDLPEGLTTICDGAFYNCTALEKLLIPDSVTEIGVDAFVGCDNLTIIASHGSYAEKYAESNGIKHSTGEGDSTSETLEQTSAVVKVEESDVPATGVDTPYGVAFTIIIFCAAGLVALKYVKREDYAIA